VRDSVMPTDWPGAPQGWQQRIGRFELAGIFMRQATMPCLVTDVDGRMVLVNDAFGALVGVPQGRLVERPLAAVSPDLAARLPSAEAAAVQAQDRFDATVTAADGRRVFLDVSRSGFRGQSGEAFFLWVMTDATDRHRLLDAFTASESPALYDAAGSLDLLWRVELATGRLSCSDAFRRLLGADENAMDPAVWRARIHADDLRKVDAALASVSEDRAVSFDCRVRGQDGGWRWLAARGVVERDATGGLHVVGTATDISAELAPIEDLVRRNEELIRNAAVLEEARAAAEAAARAKSMFLANMSHEIRTPANGIVANLELLAETTGIDTEQQELVNAANIAARSLLRIIGDILDFSKIEADEVDLEPREAGPPEIVEDVVALLWSGAVRKGLSLVSQLDVSVPARVRCDSFRIHQVLVNLIGNAIKFTETGGILLTLAAEEVEGGRATLVFEVHDTGVGFPPEIAETLFQPFNQADASTTRRFGGTGLGLAISHRLVTLMGGTIGADSTPGEGATFWFRIPVEVVDPASALPPVPLDAVRVLVVDDDPIFRTLVPIHLRPAGAVVDVAESGEAGIAAVAAAAARAEPYDVVLVDYMMPGVDGIECGRRLVGQGPALVMMTGADDLTLRRAAHQVGFNHFIEKPFRQNQLRAVIGLAARIPRRAEDASPAPAEAAPGGAAGVTRIDYPEPILVAEDLEMNRDVVRRQLAKLGVHCEMAENGRVALEMLEARRYPMAIVDCLMPEMDGYELTRALRERERQEGGHMPVVALTANALRDDADKCLAAGMDDYITKPVSLKRLAETLRRWLPDADGDAIRAEPVETPSPAAANPDDDPPIRLAGLAEILGEDDPEVLDEMVGLFIESVDPLIAEIRTLGAAGASEALRRVAHAAKGAARNAAADPVAELLSKLEAAAKADESAACTVLAKLVDAEYARLRTFVEARFAGRGSRS